MRIYNLDDYKQMFGLSEVDLQKSILSYPGGFASVNAELTASGGKIISIDPLYELSPEAMQKKVKAIGGESADLFLSDYAQGKQQGRYQTPSDLSAEKTYDLLLSADYLFANGHKLDQVTNQFCRMATEVRIFPLPDVAHISAELGPLMLSFQQRNFGVEVRAISYPKRHNGEAMLRIWAKECKVC